MLFSNYGGFQRKDRALLAGKKRQDQSLRRLIGMLGIQRKLKTISFDFGYNVSVHQHLSHITKHFTKRDSNSAFKEGT